MSIGYLIEPPGSNHAGHTWNPRDGPLRRDSGYGPMRSQLEAVAYGVNVRASMNMSQHAQARASPPKEVGGDCGSPSRSCQDSPPRCHGSPDGGREPRAAYSDQEQFFIMYSRIVEERDWRRIEDDFERIFGQRRPKDGLTAVYYRIRKSWGMPQVLQSAPERYREDVEKVHARSKQYSNDFLRRIGYSD